MMSSTLLAVYAADNGNALVAVAHHSRAFVGSPVHKANLSKCTQTHALGGWPRWVPSIHYSTSCGVGNVLNGLKLVLELLRCGMRARIALLGTGSCLVTVSSCSLHFAPMAYEPLQSSTLSVL